MAAKVAFSPPPEATRAVLDIEVRYKETDQMGVVHHANYVVWFELARTHLCKESGFDYAEIEEMGYFLIVSKVDCRYSQPAHYGDTVQVAAWLQKKSSRGLTFAYEVTRDDQHLARGSTEHLWLDRRTRRPTRPPKILEEPFSRLAGLV